MKPGEADFHKYLNVLAEQCNYTLSTATIALYDKTLSPYGYPRVNAAMVAIFKTRRGGDRFPSVADIMEKMGITVSYRSLAVDCANLIFATFNKWRLNFNDRPDFEDQFRKLVGDLPWEVVERMGGYRALYREWNECGDVGVMRAQVRDAAQAVLELTRASDNNDPAIEARDTKQIGGGRGTSK
jgi:hypothetical protein